MPDTRKPRDPFEIIAQRWATYRIVSGADAGLLLVTTDDYEDEVVGPLDSKSEEIAHRIVYAHNACIDYEK